MKDVLIPLGLLLFIGVFAFALIATARKQRKMKARAFRDFARDNGLRYQATDDGTAQDFAADLDGIGQFHSPSLGDVIPSDLVSGTTEGMAVVLFRHSTRFYDGHTREWFVAGVRGTADIAEHCSIQFLDPGSSKDTMYLQDPVVEERKTGSFQMVVRAPSRDSAGRIAHADVLGRLSSLADTLPLRPEIQVRGSRVAVYPADRNETVDDAAVVGLLLDCARRVATMLA